MILCANPAAQFRNHQEEIEAAVLKVMRGDRYILGEEVEALEREFAEFIGTKAAIGVANGTDALELSLRALDIGLGDEVITVSHTAVATVAAIEAAGATPVLVDVDPVSYTLQATQLQEVLTPRSKAVIAVHLYGHAADLDAIGEFCAKNRLELIEDVSQAHGARLCSRRLGSIGRIACFSCYPTKNLGAIGDGGLVTTNDESLAMRVREVREYGWRKRYVSESVGRNSRLDELQAAVLRVKLRHLDKDNAKRRELAAFYSERLINAPLVLPAIHTDVEHAFHLYVVLSGNRMALIDNLKASGIIAGIHYPIPVHLQPAYKGRLRLAKSMHVTETLSHKVLSLPIYPEISFHEATIVTDSVSGFFGNKM